MIDENKKCKEYLNNPEKLVKYIAEKLSIPFGSRRIWAGMTYYAQFIPELKFVFFDRINSFTYAPFSRYKISCFRIRTIIILFPQ